MKTTFIYRLQRINKIIKFRPDYFSLSSFVHSSDAVPILLIDIAKRSLFTSQCPNVVLLKCANLNVFCKKVSKL